MSSAEPTQAPQVTAREFGRALLLAVLIGIPVSLLALGFLGLVNVTTELLWDDVPGWLGMDGAPSWWYLVLVPTVGGVAVALARRLPGHASHGPLDGFARHTDPHAIPGILLAALLTLSVGAVLGPEAPLLALGAAMGLVFARRAAGPVQQMSSAAGGFAAFSALLGNPLVTAMFLLEATSAKVASAALVPGLAASGVGYLVFAGGGELTGIEVPTFTVPGLPSYTSVAWTDLAWGVPVSVLAAVVAVASLAGGKAVAARTKHLPMLVAIPAAGLVVGLIAAAWVEVSGQRYDLLMFSGEAAIPQLVAETSAGTVLLLLVLKGLAYAVSLGGGFRGGPVFPALFIGVGVGILSSLVLPGFGSTPAVACAMAAAASAAMRLPFGAAALSLLLVENAGGATTTMTILGAVIGFVVVRAVTAAVERRAAKESADGLVGGRP